MLKYKGYIGTVEYDSDGKIFTGEVIGLRAVLTFQGHNPDELESSFRDTVDLYLDMCKEDKVSPEKPYSGHFNVRISPELHRDIAYRAAAENKSINDWTIETFQKEIRNV